MYPLIGITSATHVDPDSGLTYSRAYNPIAKAVERAGGLPVLIPTDLEASTLRAVYDRVDGVLLPGGPDIDPTYYGEAPHPTVVVDAPRDAIEVPLVRWAVEDDKPLFGICRGHQVINVALGGSLIQDIPSQGNGNGRVLAHAMPKEQPRSGTAHDITIEADSRLAAVMGTDHVGVNSLHHQGVRRAAPGMRVTALAPDGVIEATELPDRRFVLSVQWHPEDMWRQDDTMLRLFSAFVEACRARSRA